ncbi:hypothetical protein [Dyadobacter pollutisoli]|jgi:hypothetical protein|uniref:Uncharacterized protein n=1 Tax=Dyadobacter pollutisoli TaxID=2910158 RepID=A0A9E8SQ06_9BACT|nr:hypothetical protein [Dyadobacter pollutisoli]WAC15271.1 hypothetical protein ON006_15150 [Dyadobacter pollutisoli]
MDTLIKKTNADNNHDLEDESYDGPMMVWTGVRSAEDVKLMSDWASKRKKELSKKESPSNNS